MPALELGDFTQLDAVQLLYDGEHAVDHGIDREVGTQHFLRDGVTLLAQLLAVEADIPRLQVVTTLLGSKGPQRSQILLGKGFAALAQVTQEAKNLIGAFGHLGCQRQFGVVGKPQQLSQLLTQQQNLVDDRAVVELAGVGALVGGAGAESGVNLLAQRPI